MQLLLIILSLLACGEEPVPDPCEEWTWIEEENCLMDICGEQEGATDSECREGECWCCNEDECWDSTTGP